MSRSAQKSAIENQVARQKNTPVQHRSPTESSKPQDLTFIDRRPETVIKQKLQAKVEQSPQMQKLVQLQTMVDNSQPQNLYNFESTQHGSTPKEPQVQRQIVPDKRNHTGMPDSLKAGLEHLSGLNLSGVRVHHNSSKPAQLKARAFAQGQDIHMAPGQEQHLAHEGWHVVQQMQGRVKPTIQAKDLSINDDQKLEHEADIMGARAIAHKIDNTNESTTSYPLQRKSFTSLEDQSEDVSATEPAAQMKSQQNVIQAKVGFEFQTYKGATKFRTKADKKKYNDHATYTEDKNDWHVDNDGGDLEVVTEPFDETPAGRDALFNCLVSAHSWIDSMNNKSVLLSDIGLDLTKRGDDVTKENVVLEVRDMARAHPQATVGLPLDQLFKLMELLTTADYDKRNDADVSKEQQRAHKAGWLKDNIGKKYQEKMKLSVNKVKNAEGVPDDNKLKGFLALLGSYIRGPKRPKGKFLKPTYGKNVTPIMARTQLDAAFQTMDSDSRAWFRTQLTSIEGQGRLKKIFGRSIVGTKLFPEGTKKDPKSPDFYIYKWLLNISKENSAQSEDLLSEPNVIGFGTLEDTTDLGPDAQGKVGRKGVIVELRRLRANVDANDWVSFGLNVFDLVVLLNQKVDASSWDAREDQPEKNVAAGK